MKWIRALSSTHMPYYIYKINKGDNIIYNPSYDNNNKFIIILHGIICLFQVYSNSNRDRLPLAILKTNNIINFDYFNKYIGSYYKIFAFEQTYLVSFCCKNLKKNTHIKKTFLMQIIQSYQATLVKYKIMNNIMMHKNTKYRTIHFLFFICLEFGIIYQKKILVPFTISQNNLATIIGSNQITINKIINQLTKNMLIKYSSKKIIYIPNYLNLYKLYLY